MPTLGVPDTFFLDIPWRHVPMTKPLKRKILQLRFLHFYHVIHTSSINQWIIITSGELKTYQQHIQYYALPCWPTKNIFPLNLPKKKRISKAMYMTFFRCTFPARFPPVFSSARLSGGHHLWIPGDDDLRHAAPCRLIHLWVSPRMCPTGELTAVEPEPKSSRFVWNPEHHLFTRPPWLWVPAVHSLGSKLGGNKATGPIKVSYWE